MAYGLGASTAEAAAFADETSRFIQDLIAFKDIGGDVIEITQGFMSGVAGNTRNFRQWGSIVKEANVQARLHEKGLISSQDLLLSGLRVKSAWLSLWSNRRTLLVLLKESGEMMLSVQRRYLEQTKQMKENVGESLNKFFLPLKKVFIRFGYTWNTAHAARENYLKGNKTFIDNEANKNAILEKFTKAETLDFFKTGITGKKFTSSLGRKNMKAEEFTSVVDYYSAPYKEVLKWIEGFATLAEGELEKVEKYYEDCKERSHLKHV